ncbi:MAG: hypothetical protein ACJASC_000006 [Limimaricola cinnabarinus]|jgi:hypothetical protein
MPRSAANTVCPIVRKEIIGPACPLASVSNALCGVLLYPPRGDNFSLWQTPMFTQPIPPSSLG